MFEEAKCKVCGFVLNLEIDDSYAELGDPFKLKKLATCDRCFDIMDNRFKTERQIMRVCRILVVLPLAKGKEGEDKRKKLTDILVSATQGFAQTFSDEKRTQNRFWEYTFVEMLLEHPNKVGQILFQYRKNCYAHLKENMRAKIDPEDVPDRQLFA